MTRELTKISYEQRRLARFRTAIGREETKSLQDAAKMRIILFALVCLWILVESPFQGQVLKYELLIGFFFIATSVAHHVLAAKRDLGRWPIYALFALDILLAGIFFAGMDVIAGVDAPRTWIMRFSMLIWLLVFIVQAALSLEWRYVAWTGFWVVLVRSAQYGYMLGEPGAYFESSIDFGDPQHMFDALWDPKFVSLSNATNELLVVSGITATLAIAVARSKRLVRNQAQAERQRGALARYFSPSIVDHVTQRTTEFTQPQRRPVAVMFVDIVGFTSLSENRPPEAVVAMLRLFYQRMADKVFDHDGTLDKYLGDGLMATFNTPVDQEYAATQALRCAVGMLDSMEQWNEQRKMAGGDVRPIQIGVGLHWGEAISGDIGDARRLEFGVIGDAVNVASRLEQLTRQHQPWLIVSADLLAQVRAENGDTSQFEPLGLVELRGRNQPIEAFGYQPSSDTPRPANVDHNLAGQT